MKRQFPSPSKSKNIISERLFGNWRWRQAELKPSKVAAVEAEEGDIVGVTAAKCGK